MELGHGLNKQVQVSLNSCLKICLADQLFVWKAANSYDSDIVLLYFVFKRNENNWSITYNIIFKLQIFIFYILAEFLNSKDRYLNHKFGHNYLIHDIEFTGSE